MIHKRFVSTASFSLVLLFSSQHAFSNDACSPGSSSLDVKPIFVSNSRPGAAREPGHAKNMIEVLEDFSLQLSKTSLVLLPRLESNPVQGAHIVPPASFSSQSLLVRRSNSLIHWGRRYLANQSPDISKYPELSRIKTYQDWLDAIITLSSANPGEVTNFLKSESGKKDPFSFFHEKSEVKYHLDWAKLLGFTLEPFSRKTLVGSDLSLGGRTASYKPEDYAVNLMQGRILVAVTSRLVFDAGIDSTWGNHPSYFTKHDLMHVSDLRSKLDQYLIKTLKVMYPEMPNYFVELSRIPEYLSAYVFLGNRTRIYLGHYQETIQKSIKAEEDQNDYLARLYSLGTNAENQSLDLSQSITDILFTKSRDDFSSIEEAQQRIFDELLPYGNKGSSLEDPRWLQQRLQAEALAITIFTTEK